MIGRRAGIRIRFHRTAAVCLGLLLPALGSALAAQPASPPCTETVTARVVALDTTIFANRLGAQLPGAMVFALANDVEPDGVGDPDDWTTWQAGKVKLKHYKRQRPIVLRVNKGQCLTVLFRNLTADSVPTGTGQPTTRQASLHVQGLNWFSSPGDDGSWVGDNDTEASVPSPGAAFVTYKLYAPEEGPFLLYSTGDIFTSTNTPNSGSAGGDGGQLQQGLFGALHVEPETAEHYRSQVNHEDLCLASKDGTWAYGRCTRPADKLPQIDYQAVYPEGHPRAGLPILRMARAVTGGFELVHSDLTAVITGPGAGRFPESLATTPGFHEIRVSPDRLQPFREFTIIYHEMDRTLQAFQPLYANKQLKKLMEAANDNFAINYGMGGIGSEILANRFQVGPAGACTDCKYEEFFLSSWPNGDPAMVVDNVADNGCSQSGTDYTTYQCTDHTPATQSRFPDDPSNVYHGYLRDHTRFRILHGGSDLHHIHHLHAHQWLHSPNTSSGHYLDSQAIGPGAAYTLEIVHDGGGNKNLTPGDSIFHCHFYPHFASGMWSLWRVHDVFEAGTELTSYPEGEPKEGSRALPDGEIAHGTPIPALVPLPTLAMAPLPAPVRLTAGGKQAEICTDRTFSDCVSALAASGDPGKFKNPGYPFFIPGVGGSRAPHPPMDFALACSASGEPCSERGAACGGGGGVCQALDGGLPRHVVATGGTAHAPALNPLDFSKEVESATGIGLPEDGTVIEKVAMAYHAVRNHPSATPEGGTGSFVTNGLPPAPGAPYAEPCIDQNGQVPPALEMRDYYGVDFQTTAVFNKEGWHYPQQRMIALWGDLFDFLDLNAGSPKAPEPFFIRANSNDCVRYHLANLIPKTYELDDFQVRTPTDILGQHIHLVKFDVTSSDGGGNGFNYEDGTLAPDEVTERIAAFNNGQWQPTYGAAPSQQPLEPRFIKFFGTDPTCPEGKSGAPGVSSQRCACQSVRYDDDGTKKWAVRGGRWCGAQATVQRWYVDPTLNDAGDDLTLRTVFTHDHFGPSTHQQAGVYAALVSEPTNAEWLDNETGAPLGNRTAAQNGVSLKDGGPTSWQAVIKTADADASFREFLLAFQDSALMYRPFPASVKLPSGCPSGAVCGFCSTDLTKACVTDPTSSLYYAKVCPASVSLPNTTGNPSQLEASCNFVPGVPSKNSLFYALSSSTTANIWGVSTTSPSYPQLQALGWDTLPIAPAPSGLVVQGRQGTPAQPELITLNGAGDNFSLSYRNEPVYPRFYGDKSGSNPQVSDPAFAYASIDRGKLPGERPSPYADLTAGVQPGDPFTPLLRANAGDNVQIRLVVGAHQNPHNFVVNGLKWLYEPSNVNSGWRSEQTMGISEHFEYLFRVPPPFTQPGDSGTPPASTDYLYRSTAARGGQASGNWGILRAYNQPAEKLFPVPGHTPAAAAPVCPAELMNAACGATDGKGHMLRCYSVVAAVASNLLGGKTMLYNTQSGLTGPNALLFVHETDYQQLRSGKAVPGISPTTETAEPLVLRAAAGDCIKVTLTNKINAVGGGFASGQLPVDGLPSTNPSTQTRNLFVGSNTSMNVGLHPQLVSYDAGRSDGNNVGLNAVQTAAPNQSVTYWWYAGSYDPQLGHVPVELGAANLMPADPLNHHPYSLFGALIIEPEGATWTHDPNSYASATVTVGGRSFREHVLMTQDDAVIQLGSTRKTTGAVNLRTLPLVDSSSGSPVRTCLSGSTDFACVFSSQAQCLGTDCTAQTPVYCTEKGQEARLRVLQAGGAVTGEVFELFGHTYAEQPYVTRAANCAAPVTHTNVLASQTIGVGNECPDGNLAAGPSVTEWKGSRSGHGPGNHYDIVVTSAGGINRVPGDYLYRTITTPRLTAGLWGIFRVTDGAPTAAECPSLTTPQ
jgi:hypothetical protein